MLTPPVPIKRTSSPPPLRPKSCFHIRDGLSGTKTLWSQESFKAKRDWGAVYFKIDQELYTPNQTEEIVLLFGGERNLVVEVLPQKVGTIEAVLRLKTLADPTSQTAELGEWYAIRFRTMAGETQRSSMVQFAFNEPITVARFPESTLTQFVSVDAYGAPKLLSPGDSLEPLVVEE